MRGYFGIGVEGISKPMNLGALMRTGHAFGASFIFSVNADAKIRDIYNSDTSKSVEHVPYHQWDALDDMALPKGCQLVGVELTDDAVELPAFRHPPAAAYVLGREKGDLTREMLERCSHVVKIPTKFCINVSLAGALVMYDRVISMGGYAPRPIMPGGPREPARRGRG
ncbi:MAG: RNA methyltransferase [Pseudomonadota bacterium]